MVKEREQEPDFEVSRNGDVYTSYWRILKFMGRTARNSVLGLAIGAGLAGAVGRELTLEPRELARHRFTSECFLDDFARDLSIVGTAEIGSTEARNAREKNRNAFKIVGDKVYYVVPRANNQENITAVLRHLSESQHTAGVEKKAEEFLKKQRANYKKASTAGVAAGSTIPVLFGFASLLGTLRAGERRKQERNRARGERHTALRRRQQDVLPKSRRRR